MIQTFGKKIRILELWDAKILELQNFGKMELKNCETFESEYINKRYKMQICGKI